MTSLGKKQKLLLKGVAAIDLGTNTFRLLARGVHEIEYVRLGKGVDKSGKINSAAIARAVVALKKFKRIMARKKLKCKAVVGTSALRDAVNREQFCKKIKDSVGFDVNIISGEQEAALTFAGSVSTLKIPANKMKLVSDVGGGSTELIWGRKKVEGMVSLKLGSVRMTERYKTQGRISPAAKARLMKGISKILKSTKVPWKKIDTVIGVGGTATTLSAIIYGIEPYDVTQIHGSTVPYVSIEKILSVTSIMTPKEREILPSVPKGRSDILVAGTAIQAEIIRIAGTDEMVASDSGILTGILNK